MGFMGKEGVIVIRGGGGVIVRGQEVSMGRKVRRYWLSFCGFASNETNSPHAFNLLMSRDALTILITF